MTKNQTNQRQPQEAIQSRQSAMNNAEHNAEATDLHIEQTTPMLADKEAFKEQ
ncbi:hypothetical protein [Ammoniphilus sp. 3BR4]|uniref:hypothetical protein n=1 Tax=Ammoniphilus sp. 3BR4 TaxID=3158265 RepID=UPI003465F104